MQVWEFLSEFKVIKAIFQKSVVNSKVNFQQFYCQIIIKLVYPIIKQHENVIESKYSNINRFKSLRFINFGLFFAFPFC